MIYIIERDCLFLIQKQSINHDSNQLNQLDRTKQSWTDIYL